jgi:D-alanyl-D-alanine carboxypeptidase
MSPELLAPPVTRPEMHRRRRHRGGVVAVAVLAVAAAAVAIVVTRGNQASEPPGRVITASTVTGATTADLLRLEAALVGRSSVADPATGRLPDVNAFHRAGISSMRIDAGRFTVTFLRRATAAQIDRARQTMLAAPVLARLADGLDLRGVQEALQAAVSGRDGPPGIFVTASTARGVWAGSAGVADLTSARPMSPALQYRVGSTTKTLTAVVVLQLVGAGRVALGEPISTYLPGVLPYGDAITVRQLLSHTSGLVDTSHFGAANLVPERDAPRVKDPALRARALEALREGRTNMALVVPPEVYLAVVATRPLAFPPGSAYTYSNTDYVVLTMLVEKLTRHTLADEFARRIIDPLHLAHTFVATDASFPTAFSRSYSADKAGKRVDTTADLALGAVGSGSIVSTAADMTTFFRALLGGRLLPAELLTEMKTSSPQSVVAGTPYGLAMEHHTTPCGVTAVGHGGAIGGYLTDVYASDDGRTVVVYVQNATGTPTIDALRDRITADAFCAAERV